MTTRRLLQFCIAMMASLATLMLGLSQDDVSLAVVAVTAASVSLVFCDILGWFYLHRFVAGAAGVVAGIYAFMQSQTGGLETQFISVANLLIHLQIILLFQWKTPRIYWQLITLTLLQVVVAAALNLFFLFGPLLVLYSAFALAAMLLFFIHRETTPYIEDEQTEHDTKSDIDQTENTAVIQLQKQHVSKVAPKTVSAGRPRRELMKKSLLRHFVMLAINTMLVSACVFLLMPRFGDGVWRAKSTANKTGFSGEVDLENSGSIYESPTVVMRVSFTDEATGEPYLLSSEPYFRGSVLTDYARGKWFRNERKFENMNSLAEPKRIYSAVRQKVVTERPQKGPVFGVAPACRLAGTPRSIRINNSTQELEYEPRANDDAAEYSIGTLAFRNGLQSQFIPAFRRYNNLVLLTPQRQARQSMQPLAELADQIVANLPEEAVLSRARALEAHFTRGSYKYSLDPSPERNSNEDPIVDFVTNHKTGHCQYFASALAKMLHTQGIPARVVVGYRADNFNVVGNYYQLREMDAHAWVEAALPESEVPDDEILPTEGVVGGDSRTNGNGNGGGVVGGAWVRLDPTPSGDWVANNVAISPWRQKLGDSMDYMQLLWSEYVLGLNEKRQRKAIYEPIKNFIKHVGTLLFSRESWQTRWEILRERFRGDFFTQENGRDAVIAIAVLTAAFYVLKFCFRLLWRLVAAGLARSRRASGSTIEFYRRLETILSKYGIKREQQQTQQEFALLAGEKLNGIVNDEGVARIPTNIVNYFYRVRYGNDRLDTAEVQRLENWLDMLQTSLAGTRK